MEIQHRIEAPTSPDQTEARTEPRTAIALKGLIQVKVSPQQSWNERVEVTSVSRNGAGFTTSKPCAVGKLVMLALDMPADLRAYDHFKNVYAVVGIVQYCNPSTANGNTAFHVGVGFIGKQLPASYTIDPLQSYRITGVNKDGLWNVKEFNSEYKTRRHTRYWLSVRTTLSTMRNGQGEVMRDEPMTLNVSAGGAMVLTQMEAQVGDKLKFACKEVDFYTIAIVRACRRKDGVPACLHLEFQDSVFPVEKLRPTSSIPKLSEVAPPAKLSELEAFEAEKAYARAVDQALNYAP
jgi:hypothetical protein